MKQIILLVFITLIGVNGNTQGRYNYGDRNKPYDQYAAWPGCEAEKGEDGMHCTNDSVITFLRKNIIYPQDCFDEGIIGKVWVYYIIDETGEIKDVCVIKKVHSMLDAEALRVFKLMPRHSPAIQNGVKIASTFRVPVNFICPAPTLEIEVETEQGVDPEDDHYFIIYETPPAFTGCEKEEDARTCTNDKLMKYIQENIEYPKKCKKNAIEGKVWVRYEIDETGEVRHVKIKEKSHPKLNKEALRIIRTLPKFTPGNQRGKNVAFSYVVPVVFKLD